MLCNAKINFETLINTVYVCLLGNISFISYNIYQNKYLLLLVDIIGVLVFASMEYYIEK
jgi:hypothetical protein